MQLETVSITLTFGTFTLDPAGAQLSQHGRAVALRPKAFDVLMALARRPGELLSKDDLLDAVWGTRFVSEGVVKSAVAELRAALADDAQAPRWIQTVSRRGYRFVGEVSEAVFEAAPGAPPPAAATAGNLPAFVPRLVGRHDELERLGALIRSQRLLTLTGPTGVGKTSLSLAAVGAQRPEWPNGVWFVELAALPACVGSVAEPAAALRHAIVSALLLAPESGSDAAALVRAVSPLQCLLVLDNGEHLLDALAPLVAALLASAPGLHIVVTSQEPLRIKGEQVFRVEPLAIDAASAAPSALRPAPDDAVRLFLDRVAARLEGFAPTPVQCALATDICRALDGLPLALELAAARVPVLGLEGIAALLAGGDGGARLALLSQGARNAPARQRTLHDAMTWSHGLLDATQQRVFRRLAVFSDGFSLPAAQAVCGEPGLGAWRVLDALHALVDKSLVGTAPQEAGAEVAAPRLRLLESLRAFAHEHLLAAGEEQSTRQRHLEMARAYWSAAGESAMSEPSLAWLARHRPEIGNLRAALRYASAMAELGAPAGAESHGDAALGLVGDTPLLWHRAGLADEGRRACESVRHCAASTHDARLRLGLPMAIALLGMYANAYPLSQLLPAAEASADGFEALGDAARAYVALYVFHQLSLRQPASPAAWAARERLRARIAAVERPEWGEMQTRLLRHARGYEERLAGRPEGYLAFCRSELARCRRLGAVAESWQVAQGQMLAEHDRGATQVALGVGAAALDEIRAAGRLRQHAPLLALWIAMLVQTGDALRGRAALAEALPIVHGAGTPWMLDVALAWLAANEGRHDDAARLLGWAEGAPRSALSGPAGATVAQAATRLRVQLREALGDAALLEAHREGAALDAAAAEELAMRRPV